MLSAPEPFGMASGSATVTAPSPSNRRPPEIDVRLHELESQCKRLEGDLGELHERLQVVLHPAPPTDVIGEPTLAPSEVELGKRIDLATDVIRRSASHVRELLDRLAL